MINLYLAPVNSKGEIIYNYEIDSENTNFTSLTDSILIRKMRISTSIFSPPVVVVDCKKDEVKLNKSIYFNSTFGIVMEEIETYKMDYGEEKESHLTCLISNQEDRFTPFAVTAVDECEVDECEDDELRITLMEKNALSLALTHSFACIGHPIAEYTASGCLSVAEIVERLSTIPRDQNTSSENEETEQKSIFNFKSTYCHFQGKESEKFGNKLSPRVQFANYVPDSCAFLSRFVAPKSQSRLQIISSLMLKYGYGFVYRPLDEQYFAIDLLSMIAPGYKNGTIMGLFINDNRPKSYTDRVIFHGSQTDEYFRDYAIDHMQNYTGELGEDKDFSDYVDRPDLLHYFSHNFANFYQTRLLGNLDNADATQLYEAFFSALGSGDYCYFSRHTPPSFSACPQPPVDGSIHKFGFYLSYLSKIFPLDIAQENIEKFFSPLNRDGGVVLFQSDYHMEQEGAFNCLFEDEVINLKLRDNNDTSITTVGQRLVYARYKLDYMQKNYIEQGFEFKNNNGISRHFNLTYELFNWLGFHTDIFKIISNFHKMFVEKNNPVKSSGATHSIGSDLKVLDQNHENYNLNSLTLHSNPDYSYIPNSTGNYSSSLFGKLYIYIESDTNDEYNLDANLTFYNDITDYNIDPFAWRSNDNADYEQDEEYVDKEEKEYEKEWEEQKYENEQEEQEYNNEQEAQIRENRSAFEVIQETEEENAPERPLSSPYSRKGLNRTGIGGENEEEEESEKKEEGKKSVSNESISERFWDLLNNSTMNDKAKHDQALRAFLARYKEKEINRANMRNLQTNNLPLSSLAKVNPNSIRDDEIKEIIERMDPENKKKAEQLLYKRDMNDNNWDD